MGDHGVMLSQIRNRNCVCKPGCASLSLEVFREDDDPNTGWVVGVWRRADVTLGVYRGQTSNDRKNKRFVGQGPLH